MCIWHAAASDKVYQLLAHGRWFSPGTPAYSTTKTGRHDIAEILLKVALKSQYCFRHVWLYVRPFVSPPVAKVYMKNQYLHFNLYQNVFDENCNYF
jgi:hypothetical protein